MNFKYEFSIVVIIKNEQAYIEEWIVYHKLIGFDHIYIFNNGSNDNTQEILQKYIYEGYISVVDFPGIKQQIPAYNYAIKKYKKESKYLAFIDADEFVYVHSGNLKQTVDDIMKIDKRASGLAINWRMFGSSGHEQKPEGFVIANYLYRAAYGKPGNECVKSLVNPRKVLFFHNPHYPIYLPFTYSIDENGEKVKKWVNELENTRRIQINHYFTKSKEEWIERRSAVRADNGKMRAMEEFYKHDNNDIYDNSMMIYVEEMEKLLSGK